jgi:hypothetical protein
VLVRFPFANRAWALPTLIDLYRAPELDKAEGRPHRTCAQLMCRLLRLLLIRFPKRTFVFAGDAGYGTHEVARFCYRHRPRLSLVSKLHPDANLFAPAPPYSGKGRPRVKGDALPEPRAAAATARCTRLEVPWYGGGTRLVAATSGTGSWYKSGRGLAPIRWVFVRDLTGTHRDEYLFTTDTTLAIPAIVATYCGRWNIETTFQEARCALGLESTCGWCKSTVLRAAPRLLGLYSVVALFYHALPPTKRTGGVSWPGEVGVSFSDALASVRRWLWVEAVFPQTHADAAIQQLPPDVRELLLHALAPAA